MDGSTGVLAAKAVILVAIIAALWMMIYGGFFDK